MAGRITAACADQAGELLARHGQFERLDAEEIADALEVVRGGPALARQVAVELGAVDRQLAAHLGDRAVVAAEQFQVAAEGIGHMTAPADAKDAILASTRISSPRPAKLSPAAPSPTIAPPARRAHSLFRTTREKASHARSSQ